MGVLPVSSDFDAEFARAADLLESKHRADAERLLGEIRRNASQPAWSARVELLLALDDERRRDFGAAVQRLETASAASIGLEAYRQDQMARDRAAAGRVREALAAYRSLLESGEPFALRIESERALSRLLERAGRLSEAAQVLARAATSSPSHRPALAIDRVRLGLRTGDPLTVRDAARDLLLGSPIADAARSTPPAVRRALRREEARFTAELRARRGRALIAAGDASRGVAFLERDPPSRWPEEERSLNLLALARGQARLRQRAAAASTLAMIPDDGSGVSFEAKLLRADLELTRLRERPADPFPTDLVRRAFLDLAVAQAPPHVRTGARERLIRLAAEEENFQTALEQAQALNRENAASGAFEPLWQLAWKTYRTGDLAGARTRFGALAEIFRDVSRSRRLRYWIARCLEKEGKKKEAVTSFRSLAAAAPPDLYGIYSRRRAPDFSVPKLPPLPDPSTATATYRRTDELLRLRMFREAAAEARLLPAERGRDLRLAQAEFALGRFPAAISAAKRAFPEMGTAEEGRVPDGWRRLFYPIEEGGYLPERAREFGIDPGMLRALVRQESVFDPGAKSRAGALGLTQLMPGTAKSLVRSVLRVRYRRAFLYDPGVNAQLGAAYLSRLYDRFGQSPVLALAAYNGGPTRMARVLRQNAGCDEDEVFESHPAFETRDYVRRVLLYAESYRTLYP